MKFIETKLKGAFVIELERVTDERGFFSRVWCKREFKTYELNANLAQVSIALSSKKGTLRGLHYQLPPYEEAKLVRCSKGVIYDVIVDLRPDSRTFKQWYGMELRGNDYKMIYVPEGFAHGYQTLEDNTEVLYLISQFYTPEYSVGVRWNEPVFGITWPLTENIIISDKDKSFPDFKG